MRFRRPCRIYRGGRSDLWRSLHRRSSHLACGGVVFLPLFKVRRMFMCLLRYLQNDTCAHNGTLKIELLPHRDARANAVVWQYWLRGLSCELSLGSWADGGRPFCSCSLFYLYVISTDFEPRPALYYDAMREDTANSTNTTQ